ncbi:putative ribonuclease H-like domain-containing protein, partial [Tanacetum coccineum]
AAEIYSTRDSHIPVVGAGTSSSNISGTKEDVKQAEKEKGSPLRFIALPNWFHEAQMITTNDAAKKSGGILIDSPQKEQEEVHTDKDVSEYSKESSKLTSSPTVGTAVPTISTHVPTTSENIFTIDPSKPPSTPTVETIVPIVSTPVPTVIKSRGGLRYSQPPSISNQYRVYNSTFLSQEEPKKISEALKDSSWVEAMQEELLQFQIQNVWVLVDCPKGVRPIGTKWVLKNKKDERGIVIRNKARLVAQGHTQEEGIDYGEVFALVARIKAIRLFLAYASYMGFTVYQMDVKGAFLYGIIDEEVYVMQPPSFQDHQFPHKVYKVVKAMYGLHQAPRA